MKNIVFFVSVFIFSVFFSSCHGPDAKRYEYYVDPMGMTPVQFINSMHSSGKFVDLKVELAVPEISTYFVSYKQSADGEPSHLFISFEQKGDTVATVMRVDPSEHRRDAKATVARFNRPKAHPAEKVKEYKITVDNGSLYVYEGTSTIYIYHTPSKARELQREEDAKKAKVERDAQKTETKKGTPKRRYN